MSRDRAKPREITPMCRDPECLSCVRRRREATEAKHGNFQPPDECRHSYCENVT
jgi:hypothetical protein